MDKCEKYTYDQVLEASLKYFSGDELAAKVFVDKYALQDNDGKYDELTPDDMHKRLAKGFARIDSKKYGFDFDERYELYFDRMKKFAHICPQGSPMSAIENPYQTMSASNCVVVASPEDSIEGIIDAGYNLAQLYKRRCGVGIDISTLRPEGTPVNNAAKTTTGAWSFADFFSYVTRLIGQNSRRGACMITMDVHHPDVIKFATMKHDITKVTGANVSIKLSNEFLSAVENNINYTLRWPLEGEPKIIKQIKAQEVWKIIVDSATKTAEPGLIMWNGVINNLPAHCYEDFKTVSVNPCSEISLSNFDSCRLISINLTGYVKGAFEKDCHFDFEQFEKDIATAQQMADNLVDLELELIDKIKSKCTSKKEKDLWQKLYDAGSKGRRTGLGTHGLADTLAQLKIKYDSKDAIKIVDKIYKTLRNISYSTSIRLSKERGPFSVYDYEKEINCEFIKRLPDNIKSDMKKYGRRNIAILTQAPTGSISILSKVGEFNRFNVSSGVEPVFRNSYIRRKKINPNDKNSRTDFVDVVGDKWQEFKVYHSNVSNYIEKFDQEDDSRLPDYFITSDKINWKERLDIQGTEQQYIDHSISSTINLPKGTTSETVGNIYIDAWKKGLKGVTVYVDGSRDGVLISSNNDKCNKDCRPPQIQQSFAPKRPTELLCDIKKAKVQGEEWTLFVGILNDTPYEIFGGLSKHIDIPNKHKKGKLVKNGKIDGISTYNLILGEDEDRMTIKDLVSVFENANFGAFTRTVSLALRHGVPIQYVVEQLQKDKYSDMTSLSKVLARVLKSYIKDGTKSSDKTCPTCKKEESLSYQDGCVLCLSCGYSKC